MGSSRVMGWLPLDDDCVRVILLFLRTGDVFAARASGLDCDSLLESDWEERLQEQPRPWAASVLFFWGGAWAASFGRRVVPSFGAEKLARKPLARKPPIARRTSLMSPSTRAPGRAGWARRWAQSSGARGGFSTLLGACEVRHHFAARRRALKTSRFRSERCSTTRGGRRSRRPAGPRSPRSS